jgi:hypothetical protein
MSASMCIYPVRGGQSYSSVCTCGALIASAINTTSHSGYMAHLGRSNGHLGLSGPRFKRDLPASNMLRGLLVHRRQTQQAWTEIEWELNIATIVSTRLWGMRAPSGLRAACVRHWPWGNCTLWRFCPRWRRQLIMTFSFRYQDREQMCKGDSKPLPIGRIAK